jgi:hypothetical protein
VLLNDSLSEHLVARFTDLHKKNRARNRQPATPARPQICYSGALFFSVPLSQRVCLFLPLSPYCPLFWACGLFCPPCALCSALWVWLCVWFGGERQLPCLHCPYTQFRPSRAPTTALHHDAGLVFGGRLGHAVPKGLMSHQAHQLISNITNALGLLRGQNFENEAVLSAFPRGLRGRTVLAWCGLFSEIRVQLIGSALAVF